LETWSNLRGDYSTIRNELVKVVNLLIRKVEVEKQNKQKNKELANESQKLTELQTKYDMEVRSKEELVKFLSFLRSGCFVMSISLFKVNELDAFYKFSSNFYNLRVFSLRTNILAEIDFSFLKKGNINRLVFADANELKEKIILKNIPRQLSPIVYKSGVDFSN